MLRILILILGIGASSLLNGQSAALLEPLELAQLEELRQGILVVTLQPTQEVGIVSENRSDAWKARQVAEDNRALIEAFTKHYTFSQLAFTYSDQVNSLRSGDRDGLLLTPRLTPFPPQFYKDKQLFLAEVSSEAVASWTDVKRYKRDQLVWCYPKGAGSEDAMRFEKIKDNYRDDLLEMLAKDSVKVSDSESEESFRTLSDQERQSIEAELARMDQLGFVPRNGGFLHEQLKFSPDYTEAGGILTQRLDDRVITRSPKKVYVVNFHYFQRIDWQASATLRFETAAETLQAKLESRLQELLRRVSKSK